MSNILVNDGPPSLILSITFVRKSPALVPTFSRAFTNDEKISSYLKGESWIIDVYENFLDEGKELA